MAGTQELLVRLEERDRLLLERTRREVEKLRVVLIHAGGGSEKSIAAFNRCADAINKALGIYTGGKSQ
jgi:predicted TIM-barrel fold metal-dependent hydrolase